MNLSVSLCRRWQLQLGAVVFLGGAWACGGSNSLSPSAEAPLASDTTLAGAPADSTIIAAGDTSLVPPSDSSLAQDTVGIATAAASPGPGIVFALMGMRGPAITAPYNGSKYGVQPSYIISNLEAVRARGGRMIVELASGSDANIQNPDGTFSLTKWKALIDGFKKLNLNQYIADGTLMGHFLIDEPQHAPKWGGKVIPQATVEAMAQYSKAIWPDLPTFARVAPSWLAQAPVPYVHLDAGWAQYVTRRGEVTKWIISEVAAAKRKGLGLAVGLNVLNGGNGSSKIRGTRSREWKMSAAEIRNYGTALLNQPYACGFFSWSYQEGGASYMARSDIKSAMTDLSRKAAAHLKTSCRQ
jgi:hypothetical protein